MDYKNILVIQTAFLGDVILCIPLLKVLKNKFPQAKLNLVCRKNFGDFFVKTGLVAQVIEVDKTAADGYARAFEKIVLLKPDLIVSPHRSFRTALWTWKLKDSAMSVGFSDPWSFFAYKVKVRRPKFLHDVYRQLSLLTGLGIDTSALGEELTSIKVSIPENQAFAQYKDAAVLAPGSQWATKRWSSLGFCDVAKRFEALGRKVIIAGTSEEKEVAGEIVKAAPKTIDLCGKTNILELAQILKTAHVLICNDSGTMHVATASGCPVVSVFGPTVPSQGYAPFGPNTKVIETRLQCRPCGAHGHHQCPIGTHDCMQKISGETVFKAATELAP